jgi:hypothetical protein
MYDSDVWQPSDDMVTYLFCPFEDDLSQHTQGDLQSSLDMYPFGDEICSVRIFNHCAQILIDTRSWPSRGTLRSTLPNESTFILRLLVGICR